MAKADCSYCNAEKKHFKVYQDDLLVAFLEENLASPGHVVVVPREHYTVMEQVPDGLIKRLFAVANKRFPPRQT